MNIRLLAFMLCAVSTSVLSETAPTQPASAAVATGSGGGELIEVPRLPPEINAKFYSEAVNELEPVTSEQYQDLQNRAARQKKQLDSLNAGQYKPVSSKERFEERPGAKMKELTVAIGMDSYLTFLDQRGQPWPLSFIDVGNKAYTVKKRAAHVVQVHVNASFTTATLTFLPKGKVETFFIRLVHAPQLDSNVDVAKTYILDGVSPSSTIDPRMVEEQAIPDLGIDLNVFLDGLPPEDAKEVLVNAPSDVQVWIYKKKMIVRTQKQLVSPTGMLVTGVNGWRIYQVDNPNPVFVLLDEGGTEHYAYIPEDSIADLISSRTEK